MPYAPFDPKRAVTFDLTAGQVHLQDSEPAVMVPAAALADLCKIAGDLATGNLGRSIGQTMGKRVAARLGGADGSSIEGFVEHLAGELAVAGWGSLSLERWGRAMVLVVDRGAQTSLMCAILEAALEAATTRKARCVPLVQEQHRARLLVTSAASAEKVAQWLARGVSWGEVLVRLHPPQKATGGDA
jgi:hypothetical protein